MRTPPPRRPVTARLDAVRLVALAGLLVTAGMVAPSADASAAARSAYVVVMRDPARETTEDVIERLAIAPSERYAHAVHGFAADLTTAQVASLRADPAVAIVERDRPVSLTGQVLPTGVDRVEADWSPTAKIDGKDTPLDADIAIVDTGIQPDHPDLRVAGGYNCTSSDHAAWADEVGHGTHVAGIAAARDNGFGVVGVAPGARVWAVRVFDANSDSRLSWIVCGLDWIAAQRDPADASRPLFEAVNMSLRDPGGDDGACGSIDGDAEHAAVCRVVKAGITVVAAAGNDRTDASRWIPAAYDEVITVSALADFDGMGGSLAGSTCTVLGSGERDDTFADFSNYGPDVDLIAPGKCILSTYIGSAYKVISGTSMAAPAVSGAVALYKIAHPSATPAQVRTALIAMGSQDWDTSTDPDGHPEPLLNVSDIGRVADTTVPVVTYPVVRFRLGATIGPSGVFPLRADWTATDNVGVSRVELARLATDGSWPLVDLASRMAREADLVAAAGVRYQWRDRALDPAANSSRWANGAILDFAGVQSTSATVRYGGRWSTVFDDAAWGGGYRTTSTGGATATFTFSGRGIAWVAGVGPTHGQARIVVDGRDLGTIDTYASRSALGRLVWAWHTATAGTHTVKITAVGTRNRPRVDLDGFAIMR